ncbi:hypothetical protein M1349_05770 [Patescibacteria group bacterium]|nr:hypothetical protein [Patescibacteria group bacterium]
MNTEMFEKIKSRKEVLITAVIVLFILVGAAISLFSMQKDKAKSSEQSSVDTKIPREKQNTAITKPVTELNIPYGVVYGIWSNNGSVIRGVDLGKDKKYNLATLPTTIKKVSVVLPNSLLYIDQTDERDHGKQIALTNINSNQKTVVYQADAGFGIDDYVISSNKKYIAVWEVKFAPGSSILRGGQSRIYSLDISAPNKKNLIYDETQSGEIPIRYPKAITSTGEIFTDKFLPNTDSGWAYGMSRSDFLGQKKEDIKLMENGTFGTQPFLSPDEKTFVFAGYSGVYGPGTQLKNGYKQAALTPNTLEIYDLEKNTRRIVFDSGKESIYAGVGWDKLSGKIIFSAISKDKARGGLFSLDLSTNRVDKILIDKTSLDNVLLSYLPFGSMLVSRKENSGASLGNLGESYESLDTKYSIVDSRGSSYSIESSDSFMQFIDILPSSFLANRSEVMGVSTSKEEEKFKIKSLQLQTFYFKTELPPTRERSQTTPRCRDLMAAQCEALGNSPGTQEYRDCYEAQKRNTTVRRREGVCYDSPLYLYSDKDLNVNVKINTKVYSPKPNYNPNGYDILVSDNKLLIGDQTFSKIEYDYAPGIKYVAPPEYGKICSRANLDKTLTYFAKNLKLNDQETKDLLDWGVGNVKSPYVFVSFYDQKTSEKILPLSFLPKPDTYINVVFYLKPLSKNPNTFIPAPIFKDVKERVGFTAVEISGIVDN